MEANIVFLLIFTILINLNCNLNFANSKIASYTKINWSSSSSGAQMTNILNPDEYPAYPDWKGREWSHWFRKLRGLGHGHHVTRMRHTEPIIIVRPDELLSSFSGHLQQYGTKNQAMVWSSSSFPTFVLQKAGRRVRVFDCGQMYIAGRLLNGIPVYLHDFYPAPIRNPLGGHIRYPVSKYCTHVPPI